MKNTFKDFQDALPRYESPHLGFQLMTGKGRVYVHRYRASEKYIDCIRIGLFFAVLDITWWGEFGAVEEIDGDEVSP